MSPKRYHKLKLIKSLSDNNLSTNQISDLLNKYNIKTFKGLRWTPKLVYMNRLKFLKRLERLKDSKIIRKSEHLILRTVKILSHKTNM